MTDDSAMVSTAQAAKALGVGVSSVKRWVDDGILPAYKTAGGHRKLRLADVLRLARNQDLPHLNLRELPVALPLKTRSSKKSDLVAELYRQLRTGDAEAAEGMVRTAYLTARSIADVADTLIQPVMARIGVDWSEGRIDIFHEHRATHICANAILGLKRLLDQPGNNREAPLAVGGSPEAHWHSLANLLAEVTLFEAGWNVVNLGPNTPFASFRKAARELRPRLVWLSINPLTDIRKFLAEFRTIERLGRRNGIALAVGGLGMTNELRSQMSGVSTGGGLRELAALARSLHTLPKPRGRGRPAGEQSG